MAAKTKRSRSGAIGVPAPAAESESLNIRKIENGYLIDRSGYKRGKHFTRTEFSPTKPCITAGRPEPASRTASKGTSRV